MTAALRVVVVGAGSMGKAWLRTVEADDDVELTGIADLDVAAAEAAAAELGRPALPVGPDAVDLARSTGAEAIINVTIPAAHHPVTTAALLAGFPVLGEKPVASTVVEGLSLAACAELTGKLFMVSQSRRYNRHLFAAKAQAEALGRVGIVSVDFFKAPHFGGFRDAMASPLLLDMAIHQFDMARFLLDADPVSVLCEEYNPAWSWYAGNAASTATFEMAGGARFVFNGSWCSPGAETSWNGAWRISGEHGSVLWDGDHEPTLDVDAQEAGDVVRPETDPGEAIAGSLREFASALRTGATPMGEVHANVMSLAMVEAAIQSASLGRRVALDDVLNASYEAALAKESNEDVLRVLKSWPSVRTALTR
ncbi:Gfo/Idh/MocA family protein [Sinomonas susongensis]|uniref:Gfo/Idh/MocA family protein n=1 Tax=Sinomonas susongensis TaxID=1324851 RepID=UPI0011084875|nr:Gfo/Idh/MocA family oxidoreductase [Sinomonas susongensis]